MLLATGFNHSFYYFQDFSTMSQTLLILLSQLKVLKFAMYFALILQCFYVNKSVLGKATKGSCKESNHIFSGSTFRERNFFYITYQALITMLIRGQPVSQKGTAFKESGVAFKHD